MTAAQSEALLRRETFYQSIKPWLARARNTIVGQMYRGKGRYCPVCERSSSKFLAAGDPPRIDAGCPNCSARERHRLVWLFFQRKTDLFNGKSKSVLHVAPESSLEPRLRRELGSNYITADLINPHVNLQMDITDIHDKDEIYDVIYCSHVLEHIPDDKLAMRELFRVLKNNGWAVLLVPITADKTFEDPTITDPKERLRLFGQVDHVRRYGPDYEDRLKESGFLVESFAPSDICTAQEVVEMGLTVDSGIIYYCRKTPVKPV